MAKTIYVLTNGVYSDRYNVGVFSTKRVATVACRVFKHEPNVEEHVLDSEVGPIRRGHSVWKIRLDRDTGDLLQAYRDDEPYGAPSGATITDIHGNLFTSCWASDEAHAVKIAAERRQRFLAQEPSP